LDKAQITVMRDRLKDWSEKVKERVVSLQLEEAASELFVRS